MKILPYKEQSSNKTMRIHVIDSQNAIFEDASNVLLTANAKATGQIAVLDSKIYLGLGEKNITNCCKAGRLLFQNFEQSPIHSFEIHLDELNEKELSSFVKGLWLSNYHLGLWKQNKPKDLFANTVITIKSNLEESVLTEVLKKAHAFAIGQMKAMHLVDRPANAKRPKDVAEYVLNLGNEFGFSVEILDEEALEIQGFTGILEVGRASAHPPRLIKLHYKGGDKYHLGLVGKGITFDTGGVSIKASQNMGFMKSDLGGAAAVLGTFITAAILQLPVELNGLLGVAENAVGGDAYLPSDVIRNYSGKTIEITDTDAEGRLVMADALAYMPEWCTPDLTIDIATLTGSAVRTFGYECAAIFSNQTEIISEFTKAGELWGERLWPLPLWKSYEADLKSDVADIKHFHGKPIAGAINAAKFLEYFAFDKNKWAHFDIAGVAFGNSPFSKDRAGTGYGVALLSQYLIDHSYG